MRLIFSTTARHELRAAVRYYESQLPGLGRQSLDELERALEFIHRYPEGSPTKHAVIRQRPLRRFPFVLFYASRNDAIVILSVANTHRKPRRWEAE